MGDPPVARPLRTQETAQTFNERTQAYIPRMGFDPMTPVFERAKTVYAAGRTASVIGRLRFCGSHFKGSHNI